MSEPKTMKHGTAYVPESFTVEGVATALPEQKRCYVPGIIVKSKCPKCGEPFEEDLGEQYLSYGGLDFSAYCRDEECGHEWGCYLKCEIRLSVDPDPKEMRGK